MSKIRLSISLLILACLALLAPAAYADYVDDPVLSALVDNSTNIVIADVLSTNPRDAIEGARDTAEFRVVSSLKGDYPVDKVIPLYYHLIYDQGQENKPTFVLGHRYILFLQDEVVGHDDPKDASTDLFDQFSRDGHTYYHQLQLVDQWFSEASYHAFLEADIRQLLKTKAAATPRRTAQPHSAE